MSTDSPPLVPDPDLEAMRRLEEVRLRLSYARAIHRSGAGPDV